MFGFINCKHKWRTVAIDTSCSWHYKVTPDKSVDHILLFQVCDKCNERQMEYDDTSDEGRSYAIKGNDSVARLRSKWIHGGIIYPPKNLADITYIDPSYAPLRGFEEWAKRFNRDPEMKELLTHKLVDDAFGQLVVAVKLCANTTQANEVDTE